MTMHAAVVSRYDEAPRCAEVDEPEASGPHQVVVEVLASALSRRVLSQADGSHYTSDGVLPMVPGVDGVGRSPDGTLRYFVLPGTGLGAMAERTVIDLRRSVELPADADPVLVAAAMNPAMSSWVALRRRTSFAAGQKVLVLGATGSAGRIAVQIASGLGASSVVAVGRDADKLDRLTVQGADVVVDLSLPTAATALAVAGSDVDVVLDYLWGAPAADALRAIVPARADDDQALTWVQIGSVAGADSPVPSAALRATNLAIVGSGQGSVSTRAIVAELHTLVGEVLGGRLAVEPRPVPLSQVDRAWAAFPTTSERLVIVP
ncbi:quinone oxidoreductase family protein [Microlunatus antarcticus]|uniref:NADPH:quinone reductase-like Zn-dependent oxidoreductase n=1 Tax=Microlunatus antarcticus TaxID=53388 RepID=A0A7W5JXJ8_9ACTN|nr:zinc-binding alcohol dehydrogenase family protein [Microlunatus antarcticus]MBB3327572.1 NADPH:quinone reductase-like Zn-dependent oxidoreductase [Microlunatus antarcticus]